MDIRFNDIKGKPVVQFRNVVVSEGWVYFRFVSNMSIFKVDSPICTSIDNFKELSDKLTALTTDYSVEHFDFSSTDGRLYIRTNQCDNRVTCVFFINDTKIENFTSLIFVSEMIPLIDTNKKITKAIRSKNTPIEMTEYGDELENNSKAIIEWYNFKPYYAFFDDSDVRTSKLHFSSDFIDVNTNIILVAEEAAKVKNSITKLLKHDEPFYFKSNLGGGCVNLCFRSINDIIHVYGYIQRDLDYSASGLKNEFYFDNIIDKDTLMDIYNSLDNIKRANGDPVAESEIIIKKTELADAKISGDTYIKCVFPKDSDYNDTEEDEDLNNYPFCCYYHFSGNYAVQQIDLSPDRTYRLSTDKLTDTEHTLTCVKLSGITLSEENYITEDEFNEKWNGPETLEYEDPDFDDKYGERYNC